jgi:CheY-like chemotaxis protein
MGLTGSFRGLSITEMLQLIRMSKKTGALSIRLSDNSAQTIFFRSGQVIGVESGTESLLPFLLEQRLISNEDMNAAISVQKRSQQRLSLEQILLDTDKITHEDLVRSLMSHAEQMVGALIQERRGQISFEEGAEPKLKLEIALDIQNLLMAAAVKADEGVEARKHIHDPLDIYARSKAGSTAFKARTMQLWLDDWKVFLAVDSTRTVRDISEKIRMPESDVTRSLIGLAGLGYIEAAPKEDTRSKVLIVDDSLTIQKLVEMALAKENLQIVKAADGENALRAAEEHKPDLILLDVMLPDTNGYRLCQQMRAKGGHFATVPIIMLSARDAPQDQNLGKHAGATAYMTKPFMADTLCQTVRKALS